MKKCSYCGLEYPDEETICTVDREPLVPVGAAPPPIPKKPQAPATLPQYFPPTPAPIPAPTPVPPAPGRIATAFQKAKRQEIEQSLRVTAIRRCTCGASMRAFTSKSATLHTFILWPIGGVMLAGVRTPRTLCYRCESCGQEMQIFRFDLLVAAAVCTALYGAGLALIVYYRDSASGDVFLKIGALLAAFFIWSATILVVGVRATIKHPATGIAKSDPQIETKTPAPSPNSSPQPPQ